MSTRHLHMTGVSPHLSLASRELNVVATQRTSNLSNVGSENHPVKKVATPPTRHAHILTRHAREREKCLPI